MSDLSELPALERIQRYLDRADDARHEAGKCKGAIRESYLRIAEHWESLARDAEKGSVPAGQTASRKDPISSGLVGAANGSGK